MMLWWKKKGHKELYHKKRYNMHVHYYTFGLCLKRDSSICTVMPCPPSMIGGSCKRRVVHTSRNHWYTSMAVCSSTSASSLLSLTGYCLAHQYIMIIHFFRGSRDFAKKLDSLIDLVVLHLLQYQHMPSVLSRRFLSRIARAHLIYNKYYVTYDNFDLP